MVKQNNSASKSSPKKVFKCCIMRASNHPDVLAEQREEKLMKQKKIAERKEKLMKQKKIAERKKKMKQKKRAKATAEKKIEIPSTNDKPYFQFSCCIMRAENDPSLLDELDRKKELENLAKGIKTLVCLECRTKVTPLWRKGPKGPKTLCNRCGLRLARLEKAAAKEDCGKNNSTSGSSSSEGVKKP